MREWSMNWARNSWASGNDKGPLLGCSHQGEIRMEMQGNQVLKKHN